MTQDQRARAIRLARSIAMMEAVLTECSKVKLELTCLPPDHPALASLAGAKLETERTLVQLRSTLRRLA